MKKSILILLLGIFVFSQCSTPQKKDSAEQSNSQVTIVGQMKEVMWKGQLHGKISLDTIANKRNIYGMGPLAYLRGELLLMDGTVYLSEVVDDTSMRVTENKLVQAPFFAYATMTNFTESKLPDSVQTIGQLEEYINLYTQLRERPFMFKLIGMVDSATIHIVNLPKGAKVSSPDEAHKGQVNYSLLNEEVEILGFFSTEHKAIFTHHDTFLHLHLITRKRDKMGHLDHVVLKSGSIKLLIPD